MPVEVIRRGLGGVTVHAVAVPGMIEVDNIPGIRSVAPGALAGIMVKRGLSGMAGVTPAGIRLSMGKNCPAPPLGVVAHGALAGVMICRQVIQVA